MYNKASFIDEEKFRTLRNAAMKVQDLAEFDVYIEGLRTMIT